MQRLLKKNEKKLDRSFNFRFCYIDDVLSLNNSRFDDTLIVYIPLSLKYRIRQVHIQIGLLYTLTYTSKIDNEGPLNESLPQEMISNFVVNFPFI